MFELDFKDGRPIYECIKDEMKKLIISNALKKDEKVPSVRELAASLAINPNTIQRAYRELELEGFIYSQRAKGFFVSSASEGPIKEKIDAVKEKFKEAARELRYYKCPASELNEIIDDIFKKEEAK